MLFCREKKEWKNHEMLNEKTSSQKTRPWDYSLKKDRKELKSRGKNSVELEKTLKQIENNRKRQKLFRDNHKRKIKSLDDETRKKNHLKYWRNFSMGSEKERQQS